MSPVLEIFEYYPFLMKDNYNSLKCYIVEHHLKFLLKIYEEILVIETVILKV